MRQQQAKPILGAWTAKAIAKNYSKFIKYESKVLKDKDPENLHQMRVAMRRLRSILSNLSAAIILPVKSQAVGEIAKKLGKLRDIDILQATLATEYQPDLPPEEAILLQKINKLLARKRQQAFKITKKALTSKKYKKLKQQVALWLENPHYTILGNLETQSIIPDLLLNQISSFLAHPAWFSSMESKAITSISLAQEKSLHSLRKIAKKTRYNLELFNFFYCPKYRYYVQKVKEVQTILGEIQDCFVLQKTLSKLLKQDLVAVMPTISKLLIAKQKAYWQQWQRKKSLFLNQTNRLELIQTIQYPLLIRS